MITLVGFRYSCNIKICRSFKIDHFWFGYFLCALPHVFHYLTLFHLSIIQDVLHEVQESLEISHFFFVWKYIQQMKNTLQRCGVTVCCYYVTYAFQSESTLYSCLNVKELLARNRRKIWSVSDCSGTRTHNHLARKRTLNHLARLAILAKWLSVRLRTKWLWVRVPLHAEWV